MSQSEESNEPRDFLSILADMPGVTAEMTTTLQEVIDAAVETGKSGSITLKIKVKQLDGNNDILEFLEDITTVMPKHDRKKKIMYRDAHGRPVRTDPNVLDFGTLATVDRATGELKDVAK